MLLFTTMTALLNVLEDFLQWQGTKYLRLDGNTKADDRGEMLRLFNAPVCLLALCLLSMPGWGGKWVNGKKANGYGLASI